MQIIFLPGYSMRNRDEMLHIVEHLRSAGYEVYPHEWRHWNDNAEQFDINVEVAAVKQAINQESYALVTKSIGGLVAINLIEDIEQMPALAVFTGVGRNDLSQNDQEKYYNVLKNTEFSKVFVQNRNDDHGSSQDLQQMLRDLEYELLEQEGNDHRYDYPELILELIQKYTA